MPSEVIYGFWSYAHEDNDLDDGSILELARLIREEYNLLSGEPLELFIDRDGITWGQEWRKRIDSALVETTFFIPVVTPRYFRRPECRRELLEFAAKAHALGVEELLLPILYVNTPGLSAESPDQAMALVAKTQYEDWRDIRLLQIRSREYRAAVNALACRLLEIANRVAERQIRRELDPNSAEHEAEGIADIVEKVMVLLPEWLDAVIGDKFNTAQFDATNAESRRTNARLRRSNAPASAILAAEMRYGREMLPLVERFHKDAQTYVARSIELDPLISSLARLVVEHTDSWPLVMPIREAIDEAMPVIRRDEQRYEQSTARGEHRTILQTFDKLKHLGRIFQQCAALTRDAERLVAEGNTIVRRWNSELVIPSEGQDQPG
jgi:hypothetical protein